MLLLSVMSIGQAGAANTVWHPTAGMTWQIQFAEPFTGNPLPVQVYDLDGFETDARTVAALHDNGIRVLCYISMGTLEEWRPDAGDYPPEIIGNEWGDWPGEYFVDIRRIDLLAPILEARLDMCASKGFDAVEPDNIDSYGNSSDVSGLPLTLDDQRSFDLWLANAAHERGLAIGQKNVPELTGDLVATYDFAVTEDCVADDWCEEVAPYLDANKPVFAIEYTDRTSEADFHAVCDAQTRPYSFVLKHRELDAWQLACS